MLSEPSRNASRATGSQSEPVPLKSADNAASSGQQAAILSASNTLPSPSFPQSNVTTESRSSQPGQNVQEERGPSSTAQTRSGMAKKLKRWLTETRINISIGLLGLIAVVIFEQEHGCSQI